jgi:hypothetical protein
MSQNNGGDFGQRVKFNSNYCIKISRCIKSSGFLQSIVCTSLIDLLQKPLSSRRNQREKTAYATGLILFLTIKILNVYANK